jgi:hypothetical protein
MIPYSGAIGLQDAMLCSLWNFPMEARADHAAVLPGFILPAPYISACPKIGFLLGGASEVQDSPSDGWEITQA